MTEHLTPHNVALGLSNLNLPYFRAFRAESAEYAQLLQDLQDDRPESPFPAGFELTPTRRIWSEAGDMAQAGPDFPDPELATHEEPFGSLHQTWPASLRHDVRYHWRAHRLPSVGHLALNYGGLVVMPSTDQLEPLIQISTEFRRTERTVVYAEHAPDGGEPRKYADYKNATGHTLMAQILSEGLTTANGDIRKLLAHLGSQAIDGLVIDPHHLLAAVGSHPHSYNQILQTIADEATPIYELHVAAGRIDATRTTANPDLDPKERSIQDLLAILDGPTAMHRTSLGEILEGAYLIWQRQRCQKGPLPAILEVPFAGLVEARQRKAQSGQKAKIDDQEFRNLYRALSDSLNAFFDELPAPQPAPEASEPLVKIEHL